MKSKILVGILALSIGEGWSAATDSMQQILDTHRQKYQDTEYFSAIQVSVKAGNKLNHYASGTVARGTKQEAVTPKHLFDIGSITKSFTAVLALQAEKRKQLDLQKPLKTYLKQYRHWGQVTLTQLLNMTSGLPNYSDSPTMNMAFSRTPEQYWTAEEIIALVYKKDFNPPLRTGYHYTNTGYALLDMVLQKQTKKSYAKLLANDIFQPLHLHNTFYPVPKMSTEVNKKRVAGYGYNIYANPELVGRNMKASNLSWAGAAGGIVANSEDVLHWVEALFIKDKLLNAAQKIKMQTLVSTQTGKPIQHTSLQNPEGFGLGLVEKFVPKIARFWFYEGETLGYRSLYMYVPCNKVIITALINSATNGENDHAGALMEALYHEALKQHPELAHCA